MSPVVARLKVPDTFRRFFEWSRRWESGKLLPAGEHTWADEWACFEELELHPLPAWADLSAQQRRDKVKAKVHDIETEGRRKHRAVLGVAAVVTQNPLAPPTKTKRSRKPWFHGAEQSLGLDFMARYAAFVGAFRRASLRFRSGDWAVEFPSLAFRPWVPVRV